MKNEELPDTEAACTWTVSPRAGISLIDPPHFSPPPTLFFHGIRKDDSRSVTPAQTNDQTEIAQRSRWQAVILLEAGGLSAALSDDSMRRLKYCLQ
jgi:hypothetical protein